MKRNGYTGSSYIKQLYVVLALIFLIAQRIIYKDIEILKQKNEEAV